MRFLVSVFYLFFLETVVCATHTSYSVSFVKNNVLPVHVSSIPTIFKVASFECSSDSKSMHQELQQLLGCAPGSFVAREQFLEGINRVVQKNSFEKGTFHFLEEDEGVRIVLEVQRLWILRGVKIRGIAAGKDEYARLYEQTPGDPFSFERHEESLKAMRYFLKASGYKQGEVCATLVYDDKTKTVSVRIGIDRKKIFVVSDVTCVVKDTNTLLSDHEQLLLAERIRKQLVKKKGTEKVIEKVKGVVKKWLVEEGFFDPLITVSESLIDDKRVALTVTISIEKRKKTVFFGNYYFSFHELQKKVIDLVSTGVFLPSAIIAQELQSDYIKKGFWLASVESLPEDRDRESFVIKEGKRSSVKKIVLKGVISFDERWIKKEFFRKITHARYCDEDLVEQALHDCTSWYKKQGFWDAYVVKTEYFSLEKSEAQQVLVVTIDEGKRRFLLDIEVHAVPGLQSALPLRKELEKAQAPIPFSHEALTLQRTFLSQQLRDQGYLHAHLSYRLEEQEEGFRIIWQCAKGAQVLFGKTITRGYTKIPYDRLMRLLPYREGEVWNKEKIQESLTILRSLDIFERVSLSTSFTDGSSQQRDMILMLKEDDPFEVKLRLGFAQVSRNLYFKKGSTYKTGGSFIWKNPCACADRFSIDVDFNRYEKKINAAYAVPFLCNVPLNTVFKVYANKYIQPVYIGSNKPLYKVLQQGFLMGVSKKRNHCDLGLTAGFDWMETSDLSLELARAINFKIDLVDKKIPYFFIESMAYADFLDDTLNPTQGFFGLATVKGMFPFKKSSFLVKCVAEQGTFIPFDPSVLAIRFKAGHIFRRAFDAVMPPERFYLGGPNSLRGYVQDYCPPLGFYNDDGQIRYVPQGGKTMLNANFELRIPFNKKMVWGAVFQDFGMLIEDFGARGIGSSRPLAATGFGMRYMTPVGPLRFDIGWKWQKERSEEPSYAWFLIFGNAF